MVASFALEDCMRNKVKDSIKKLSNANIDVRMISGDHLATAKSIAQEVGIIDLNNADVEGACMTGP
jgi:Ca2+-transporting ATPase